MKKKFFDCEIDLDDKFIGIGHRAQQGKDTVANFIRDVKPNVYLIYWIADLLDELANPLEGRYLIKQTKIFGSEDCYYYEIADKICEQNPDRYIYKVFNQYDVPYLHKIFTQRKIQYYYRMTLKDPEIMQFWGTDFRRKQDNYYWIKKTIKRIENIQKQNNNRKIFVFHNTRFYNEYFTLKEMLNGIYLKIERLNYDGTKYTDPNRDPNHISETELSSISPDFYISAKSGDTDFIKSKTQEFLIKYTYTV